MMFYNGFNLMIDIILVTATVYYMKWSNNINYAYWSAYELDHEYNEGYNAGYEYAMRVAKESKQSPEYNNGWEHGYDIGYASGRSDATDIYSEHINTKEVK